MAKDTGKTIAIIGILALVGYFVYKYFSQAGGSFWGGGGYSPITPPITPEIPTVPETPKTPAGFDIRTPAQLYDIHAAAGTLQAWSNATYGSPGQPSMTFAVKTLAAASKPIVGVGTAAPSVIVTTGTKTVTIAKPLAVSKGAKVVTVKPLSVTQQRINLAASAIRAGAPPRLAAKFKAGKAW